MELEMMAGEEEQTRRFHHITIKLIIIIIIIIIMFIIVINLNFMITIRLVEREEKKEVVLARLEQLAKDRKQLLVS